MNEADSVVLGLAGGKAVAVVESVEKGEKIVEAAVAAFGGLHSTLFSMLTPTVITADRWRNDSVIVNNAGILRDKSFLAMTDAEWDIVYNVHVRGTYTVCHAAWPIFLAQKYGRIINTASAVG